MYRTFAAIGAIAALAGGLALPDPAQARDARCRIFLNGTLALDRICDFQPEGRNGAFVLAGRNNRGALMPGIISVSVSVFESGKAEVRGLTRNGVNSRWGEARRSSRDRACWVGVDFRVCVY